MKAGYLVVLVFGLLLSGTSYAKNNDQTLTIALNESGCISAIVPPADDNCKDNGNERAGCGNMKDCACGARDKHITWQTEPRKAYTIRFYEQSPFQPGCRLQANSNGMLRCLIMADAEGNYDYAVTVEGCAEYDPRIVVKAN